MLQNLKQKLTVTLMLGLMLAGSLAQAGWINGPSSHVDRVEAHSTDTYTLTFRGGEYARIVVDGDGDTDLDMYVYDQFGNLIDFDEDLTDTCIAGFTPRFTGSFTIRIVNRGSVWNRYVLSVN